MRRAALLDFPGSPKLGPGAKTAKEHTIRWLSRFDMVRDRSTLAEYEALDMDRLAAYFWPEAAGPDLEVAGDLHAWFIIFDDQFDGEMGEDPEAVSRFVEAVVRVTATPDGEALGAPPSPLLLSFRDLWRRMNAGMPRGWQDRFRGHWRDYLRAHNREALTRTGHVFSSLATYLSVTRHTIGVQPCLDLIERFGGYTLPPALHDSALFAAMREAADDVVIFANDLASLDKEMAAGDVHNSVIVLRDREGRTVDEAVRRVADLANSRYRGFEEAAALLPALLADAGVVDPAGRRDAEHFVAGIRHVMCGNLGWSLHTSRYDQRGVEAVSRGRQRPWADLAGREVAARAGRSPD
ncbi:terpene synthase family protein [Streptomyces sp. NPDC005322]|uniref:terpene synthase family protein n=1 Tax=Streptomyces sp. NPDC005322 TaxID=3157032 RepID=UPI0033BE7C32